jgi:hypothetical protein
MTTPYQPITNAERKEWQRLLESLDHDCACYYPCDRCRDRDALDDVMPVAMPRLLEENEKLREMIDYVVQLCEGSQTAKPDEIRRWVKEARAILAGKDLP